MRRAWRRALGVLVPGVLAVLVGSCAPAGSAHSGPRTESRAVEPPRSAMEELRARAAAQRSEATRARERATGESAPSPPTGAAGEQDVAALDPATANTPLEEMLNAWRAGVQVPTASRVTPDEDTRAAALRRYARGREAQLAGDVQSAVEELQAAAKLDPTSPEASLRLGETYQAAGRRMQAASAYQQAVRRGSSDARALAFLGREAARGQRWNEARDLLVRALDASAEGADAALPHLLAWDLSEVCLSQGYVRAARDLLAEAVDLDEASPVQTRMRGEFSELLRRRAELTVRAGDLSARLGEVDEASKFYDRAAALPAIDPGAVLARRIDAALRLGRSAEAALLLLEDIRANDRRVEDRQLALVRRLSGTDAAPLLGRTLRELAAEASAPASATIRARLARAQAAALSKSDAAAALTRAAEEFPFDGGVLSDLLDAIGADPGQQASVLGGLVERSPRAHALIADVLVADGVALSETIEKLRHEPGAGARVLAADVASRTGHPVDAFERVHGADWPAAMRGVGLAAEAQYGVDAARDGDARAACDALASVPGAEFEHAAALRATQRGGEAFDALGTALLAGERGVVDLVFAGEAALRCGKPEQAEELLRRAVAADGQDERAYEALLAYYGGGAKQDEGKFLETARALRQVAPSGRVIRALAAREMLAKGLWDECETALAAIIGGGGAAPSIVDMYGTLGERTTESAVRGRVERRLRDRLVARPESIGDAIALARTLGGGGKPEEALAQCERVWVKFPTAEVGRVRERIVREGLKDTERANRMTRSRLEATPPTIENTLELTDLLIRTDDYDAATARLAATIGPRTRLTPEQSGVLVSLLARLPVDAETKTPAPAEKARAAAGLFDQVLAAGVKFPPILHLKRLRVAAMAYADQPERLAGIARETASGVKEIGPAAYEQVARVIFNSSSPAQAIGFFREAVAVEPAWSEGLVAGWMLAAVSHGEIADIRAIVEACDSPERLELALKVLGGGTPATRPGMKALVSVPQQRAEIAYELASSIVRAGREKLTIETYRLALEFDADHGFANNDLGYQLLEGDVNTAEVARLIERGAELLPDRASVIDSLGWLRYKQGQLEDETDATGRVRPGAVSLLLRALEDADASDNETVHDHAGDALWAAGRKDEARQHWAQAAKFAETKLAVGGEELERVLGAYFAKRLREHAASVGAKLAAVKENREPAIATRFAKE